MSSEFILRKMYTIISLSRELSDAEGKSLAAIVQASNPDAEVSHRQVFQARFSRTKTPMPEHPYSVINIAGKEGKGIDVQRAHQVITSRGYAIAETEVSLGRLAHGRTDLIYNSANPDFENFGGPVKLGRFVDRSKAESYLARRGVITLECDDADTGEFFEGADEEDTDEQLPQAGASK